LRSTPQAGLFEGLNKYRRVTPVPALPVQHVDKLRLKRKSERLVVGRMFGLGVDADPALFLVRLAFHQLDHLLERRDLELAVELLRALSEGLNGPQFFDFGERKVGGEETLPWEAIHNSYALARSEFGPLFHIGGGDQVRHVTRDEMAILGHHQIGLDVVRAQLNRERVSFQRVLGQIAASAAVTYDDRRAFSLWL
jgi:hypothetical protein